MKLVVDASVAVKWVVEEEGSDAATALRKKELAAPALLLAECANALWAKARRDQLSSEEARECLDLLRAAPVTLVAMEELAPSALDLALELQQTVYDSLYLALGLKLDAPVVTADRRFAEGVARQPGYEGRVRLLEPAPPKA